MKRENNVYESFKCLTEMKERLAEKEAKRLQESANKDKAFRDNYYIIKEMRARKEKEHSMLMEAARNDALSTVVKAIYMTALEAEALTDDGILLAESMVDTWIKESGGATKILNKVGNDSYLLSRITQIVEDAAEAAVSEIEDTSEEDKAKKEPSQKEKKEDALKATKEFLKDASTRSVNDFIGKVVSSAQSSAVKKAEEKKAEEEEVADDVEKDVEKAEDAKDAPEATDVEVEVKDDPETEENSDGEKAAEKAEEKKEDPDAKDNPESPDDADVDSDDEEIDIESIPSEDEEETSDDDSSSDEDQSTEAPEDEDKDSEDSDDSEEENTLDDSVSDEEVDDDLGSEPLDDDGKDSDVTVDGGSDNSGKIFDELEKEDDVQKAIDLIKTRVADAEEQFIRNNAEDKKKMDEVLDKISSNVKTVEDLAGKVDKKSETKTEIAKEAARMSKREYDNIVNNRPLTIFEKMTRKLGSGIIKNEAIKESYLTEDGSLDVDLVVESTKVMYGFLETLNTLRLENVNEKYIIKVLKEMK